MAVHRSQKRQPNARRNADHIVMPKVKKNMFSFVPSTVQPERYSVQAPLNTATLISVPVLRNINILSSTKSITIWKSSQGRKFELKVAPKISSQILFVFRRHSYGNGYSGPLFFILMK